MAINFPDSPSVDQEHTVGQTTWKWDGTVWNALGVTVSSIVVADESADTTCFPLFSTDATGSIEPKTGTNLTFNSNTGNLSATQIGGIAVGNLLDKTAVETIDASGWDFGYGITGGYSSDGTTWASSIWSIGASWDGGIAGAGSVQSNNYGLRWVRATNADAHAAIGEGLYIYQAGTLYGGIGASGSFINGTLHLDDNDKIELGTPAAGDAQIFSDGTDLIIECNAGVDFRVRGGSGGTEPFIASLADSGTWLYYNNTANFWTQDHTAAANTSSVTVLDHLAAQRDVGFNTAKEISQTTGNITLDNSHAGSIIRRTGTSSVSVTMAAGSEFPDGSMCTVMNHGTSGTYTISDGSEIMYIMNGDGTAPTDSTGFTLAIGGVINIWRQGVSTYYVWGAGIP